MSGPLKIILLDNSSDLSSLEGLAGDRYDAVICLFWAASSTKQALSGRLGDSCYALADIVGSDMVWGESAYQSAGKIVRKGGLYGDVHWRTYLTERIYRECHLLALFKMVAEFVEQLRKEHAATEVVIDGGLAQDSASLLVTILSNYPSLSYHNLHYGSNVRRNLRTKNSVLNRFVERIREASLTGDWKGQAMDFVEWMDKPYQWRTRIGCRMPYPQVQKGGITFFSSYLNNTRALSPFAELMCRPANWLLTNNSSLRGLPRKGKRNYSWIWQFPARKASWPELTNEELQHKEGVDSKEFDLLRAWTTISPTLKNWNSVERSLLVTLTQCWETYLEEAEPRLVVTANQWGIEGWFTQIAKRHNIPVLQVLHGVLGGYLYTQTPIISDLMVVPGEFWRKLWPGDQQHKILVCNPRNSKVVKKKGNALQKRVVTFFSWPLLLAPSQNYSELMDGFIHIFHKLVSEGTCRIIFRAHPLENPSDFVRRWSRFYGPLPPEVEISKIESLSQILSETDVALMFRSTVMLDCLVNIIPVVMPGWIDFGWNQALDGLPNVFLAPDFSELQSRVMEWLNEPPLTDERLREYFIAPPGKGRETLFSALDSLFSPSGASPGVSDTTAVAAEHRRPSTSP
jgi:hypothetical protein